ncbi:PREDICTED: leucine-rich repeat and WD repeat-containing protein 1-like isoform X2 [Priapulus caudatus]|uniref:Leucine-rich repeat and WD repeat-containing protein 1-like isoform X2 n=1 Tax=Priapulus caudatus TaxID=37621 RepID=A0ABM1DY75_PRICU|nr:PREDICTED: leucine-rich repeat and WD repeat-containing protein 1-like isoform X2 [Priapulus caudatus]
MTAVLTVEYLQKKLWVNTNNSFSDIKVLSIKQEGITEIDGSVLQKLTSLQELDVSGNGLSSFPSVKLDCLKRLNISDNSIADVTFLEAFPNLEELIVAGNPLDFSDCYIAASLLPNLRTLDDRKDLKFTQIVERYNSMLLPQIQEAWEENFSSSWNDRLSEQEIFDLTEKFVAFLKKEKLYGHHLLQKFKDFKVDTLARELVSSLHADHCPGSSQSAKRSRNKRAVTKRGAKKVKPSENMTLPPVDDFTLNYMLRCHSRRDNPSDHKSQVWRCAFEPDPANPGKSLTTVATCGSHFVCLIDCKAGIVRKRYQDDKEDFFCLAWTTVAVVIERARTQNINILIVGGKRGIVYLIDVEELVCYGKWSGHKKALGSILIHPEYPTFVFTGSADHLIVLWDIGVPTLPEYTFEHRKLLVLRAPHEVLQLAFCTATSHLIAACEDYCSVWHMADLESDLEDGQHTNAHRLPDFDVELPGQVEVGNNNDGETGVVYVDGLAMVSDDVIATKIARQGCIYLWRMSETLERRERQVKSVAVRPIAQLEWADTEQIYISCAGSGV